MTINKKGSRKIIVEDHEFRWRVTGSDNSITVVIWANGNDDCRVIGSADYHHDWRKINEGHYSSDSQAIITNRIIKKIILHVGTKRMTESKGHIDIGSIEEIYDFEEAVRSH